MLPAAWPLSVLGYYLRRVQPVPGHAFSPELRVAIAALIAPIALVGAVFLLSFVHHAVLLLLGGARSGFGETRRVVLHAAGAYWLVHWIPVVGSPAGLWLYSRSTINGLKLLHGASHWPAAFATIAPFLLCLGGLFVLFGLAAGLSQVEPVERDQKSQADTTSPTPMTTLRSVDCDTFLAPRHRASLQRVDHAPDALKVGRALLHVQDRSG